jgi:NTP pyrophosphatase (non-canonical NTP hydrolase)
MTIHTLEAMLATLNKVHEVNMRKFYNKNHRWPTVADQLKKHAEEVGEFIKAYDGKTDEDPIDEYWDSIFSMMATLLTEKSEAELIEGYEKCLNKIVSRAKV